jgi:cell division topological specificity factor MinE
MSNRNGKNSELFMADFSALSNQLILIIDDKNAEITPQLIKSLTEDMIQVISKHINIDSASVKVSLSAEDDVKKIIIHIPVVTIPR